MRGTRTWLVIGLIALFATGLLVAGCGDDDDGGETTTSAEDLGLITEGTLTVGTDTPFPPFEIGQPPNISGYDIEVMDAIADQLGVTPEYIDTGFGTIFRDTANGQFDTAAAASTITKGRENAVDFSDPYYEAQQALLVAEGSAGDVDGGFEGGFGFGEAVVLTSTSAYIADVSELKTLGAGMGMLDAVLSLVPGARVGFIGLFRDEETLEPVRLRHHRRHPTCRRRPLLDRRPTALAAVLIVTRTRNA